MESKYLDKHNKKVQEQIHRYIHGKKQLHGEHYFTKDFVINDIKRLFNVMVTVRNKFEREESKSELAKKLNNMLPIWTSDIKNLLYDYSFYKRIIDSDLKTFIDGLFLKQRIQFLGDKYGPAYWGTPDFSYIMLNFRGSMAYYDEELIKAYTAQTSAPFNSGYAFYVSLANSLFSVLEGDLEKASNYLAQRVGGMKTLKKYERSMLLAVKAIADKDEKSFFSKIDLLLDLYPKQHFYNNLADYINIEAIGLYNLAEKIWNKTPKEPESMYWDSEFILYSRKHKPKLLIDFSKISPMFGRWLKELPRKLSVTDLIQEFENKKSS